MDPLESEMHLGDTLGDRSLTLSFFYLLILQYVATVFRTIARSPYPNRRTPFADA